jgi:hypothetical protein
MIAAAVTPPFKVWTKLTLMGKFPDKNDDAEGSEEM